MADFEVKFSGNDNPNFKASMGEVQVVNVGAAPYEGDYIVTPKAEVQTLPTSGKVLAGDVTIKPIPQEYGLVTYDNRKIITIT